MHKHKHKNKVQISFVLEAVLKKAGLQTMHATYSWDVLTFNSEHISLKHVQCIGI